MSQKSITVIGAGAWGTALALHLARVGHRVTLWGRDSAQLELLELDRSNQRYLPDQKFPDNLKVEPHFSLAVAMSDAVLISTPCAAFASICHQLKMEQWPEDKPVIWSCKGFSSDSEPLNQVLIQILGSAQKGAIISGPTFAKELGQNLPTAIAIAGTDEMTTNQVVSWFHQGAMRAYSNTDLIGVQVGGALKNVYAIAAGISDGLHYGANARAALITRGLAELSRLARSMGAQGETLQGLAGLGDLLLTCTDDLSRNRRMGLALARGLSLEQAHKQIGQAVEGVRTATLVMSLAKKHHVDMPIAEQVLQVIEAKISPAEAVRSLLERSPKSE